MTILVLCAGLAAAVALSAAPFFLSWPRRLRWLIAASTVPDPWGLGSLACLGLEEFTVNAVTSCQGGRLLSGHSGSTGVQTSLWLDCVTSDDTVHLETSAAVGLALLLVVGPDGTVTLHGPTWSVSGLQITARHGPRSTRPDRSLVPTPGRPGVET
jgi:hypothetical protein